MAPLLALPGVASAASLRCTPRRAAARRAASSRGRVTAQAGQQPQAGAAAVAAGLNKYSARITQPKSQGASQAMLYATGLKEEDMNKAQASALAPRLLRPPRTIAPAAAACRAAARCTRRRSAGCCSSALRWRAAAAAVARAAQPYRPRGALFGCARGR